MKHLYVAFIIYLFLLNPDVNAQYGDFKSGLFARKTFYDYNTNRSKDAAAFIDFQNGFEIAYVRNFSNNFSVVLPFGAGIFKEKNNNNLKTAFFTFGAQAQLHVFKTNQWANPFITTGIGAIFPKDKSVGVEVPVGLGIQFMVHPQVYLHWQSDYRASISNWENHIQHHFGFVYLFGNYKAKKDTIAMKPDSDHDGIIDELDLCPNTPGLPQFAGCPDTDGDGIPDKDDHCPDLAGSKEFNGCPDTDGDGVPDNLDECPNVKGSIANKGCPEIDSDGDGVPDKSDLCPDKAGLKEFSGCPDSDGDGVPDNLDKCPTVAGSKSNDGCPETKANTSMKDSDNDGVPDDIDECPFTAGLPNLNGCPDTDGDGVMDKIDNCPTTPGPASNHGCPIIEKADKETLDFAMRAVQFDNGRATLKTESLNILDKVAKILRKYPDYNLTIGGHTDNSGSLKLNMDLSDRRAKVCYEYLISQGVPASRLSYKGYGPTKPIASNSNDTGRYLNRRVEFNLVPR